jgi:hypothetical protein
MVTRSLIIVKSGSFLLKLELRSAPVKLVGTMLQPNQPVQTCRKRDIINRSNVGFILQASGRCGISCLLIFYTFSRGTSALSWAGHDILRHEASTRGYNLPLED